MAVRYEIGMVKESDSLCCTTRREASAMSTPALKARNTVSKKQNSSRATATPKTVRPVRRGLRKRFRRTKRMVRNSKFKMQNSRFKIQSMRKLKFIADGRRFTRMNADLLK